MCSPRHDRPRASLTHSRREALLPNRDWSFGELDDRALVMQGDLIDDVPVFIPTVEEVVESDEMVVVISHSCEYTKTERKPNYPILVAPLVDVDSFDPFVQRKLQGDEVTRYWVLPEDDRLGAEMAVDLGLVQPVLRQDLLGGRRVASMPPDGRLALADRVFSMISLRERPDDQ